jgi:hypothetical protein
MVYQPMEKDDSLPLLAGHIVLQKLVAGTTPGWDMFNMIHNFFKAKVKNRLAFSAAYNKCASPSPPTTTTAQIAPSVVCRESKCLAEGSSCENPSPESGRCDANDCGWLDTKQLPHMLNLLFGKGSISRNRVDYFITMMDLDRFGSITYNELCDSLKVSLHTLSLHTNPVSVLSVPIQTVPKALNLLNRLMAGGQGGGGRGDARGRRGAQGDSGAHRACAAKGAGKNAGPPRAHTRRDQVAKWSRPVMRCCCVVLWSSQLHRLSSPREWRRTCSRRASRSSTATATASWT